jgi:hypothetical protein
MGGPRRGSTSAAHGPRAFPVATTTCATGSSHAAACDGTASTAAAQQLDRAARKWAVAVHTGTPAWTAAWIACSTPGVSCCWLFKSVPSTSETTKDTPLALGLAATLCTSLRHLCQKLSANTKGAGDGYQLEARRPLSSVLMRNRGAKPWRKWHDPKPRREKLQSRNRTPSSAPQWNDDLQVLHSSGRCYMRHADAPECVPSIRRGRCACVVVRRSASSRTDARLDGAWFEVGGQCYSTHSSALLHYGNSSALV